MFQWTTVVMCMWLSPLMGSVVTGLVQTQVKQVWAHRITLIGMTLSLVLSAWVLKAFWLDGHAPIAFDAITWLNLPSLKITFGFYMDALTAQMVWIVCFIAWLVHVYSMGYMQGDSGYFRYYSYVSLFTFMMLGLVLAGNLVQLFFGWEGVGLVSYLLIGYYLNKPTAAEAAYKAFMVNRLADAGFLIGIAACYFATGSLDHQVIMDALPSILDESLLIWGDFHVSLLACITFAWFIGVSGKSAQLPLHVWLPDSMAGPTPISALIHAATMVTAGVYMMCRFSPLYEAAPGVSNFICVVGASGGFWLGILGVFEQDIKRLVAFSTLSQLGYMVAAVGVGAYALAMFHLITHAYFKALLFLAAGSVKMAMNKDQNMLNMGGCWRSMPITAVCYALGGLSLCGFPWLSGFYSKDAILMAVGQRVPELWLGTYSYLCLLLGVGVTAFYTGRSFILVFLGQPRSHTTPSPRETFWMTLPLVVLALPSVGIGLWLSPWLLKSSLFAGLFDWPGSRWAMDNQAVAYHLSHPWMLGLESLWSWPWLSLCTGVGMVWILRNQLTWHKFKDRSWLKWIQSGYGLDALYLRWVGQLQRMSDQGLSVCERQWLDVGFSERLPQVMMSMSGVTRRLQNGTLVRSLSLFAGGLLVVIGFATWVWLNLGDKTL